MYGNTRLGRRIAMATATAALATGTGAATATAAGAATAAKAPIQAPAVASAAKVSAARAAGPFYWIVSDHSGKALMPFQESKADGQPIVVSGKASLGAQNWKIEGSGTSRFLRNRNSHMCISAPDLTNGLLRQRPCETYSLTTNWIVSNYDAMWAGKPVAWRNNWVGVCMEVYGAVSRGAICNGTTTQSFHLEYVPGT